MVARLCFPQRGKLPSSAHTRGVMREKTALKRPRAALRPAVKSTEAMLLPPCSLFYPVYPESKTRSDARSPQYTFHSIRKQNR